MVNLKIQDYCKGNDCSISLLCHCHVSLFRQDELVEDKVQHLPSFLEALSCIVQELDEVKLYMQLQHLFLQLLFFVYNLHLFSLTNFFLIGLYRFLTLSLPPWRGQQWCYSTISQGWPQGLSSSVVKPSSKCCLTFLTKVQCSGDFFLKQVSVAIEI